MTGRPARRKSSKLRELAADIINEALAAVNADIRVDHRSFKDRGIEREPTTHLGPAAMRDGTARRAERARRHQPPGRAERTDACLPSVQALDVAIETERERITSPPRDREDAQERVRDDAAFCTEGMRKHTRKPEVPSPDGLTWWQRAALHIARKARNFLLAISGKAVEPWREKIREARQDRERSPHEGGIDR